MKPYWQSVDGAITVYHARFEDVLAAGAVDVPRVALVHDDSYPRLVHCPRKHDIMYTMTNWLECANAQAVRFWGKVSKSDGCWTWAAGKDRDGYGRFSVTAPRGERPKQKHYRAHRLSWEMANGPVPDGAVIMHSCDNPACVNPAHLAPGTQTDNRADCGAKGRNATGERTGAYTKPHRMPRGERHYAATMTAEQVREIRALSSGGMRPNAIAKKMGLGFDKVWGVIAGRTWRSVA